MWRDDPASVRPMLATTATAPFESADLAYERKYDGIRAIASLDPTAARPARIWSRLGNDKSAQFPEIVARLEAWGRKIGHPIVLDGEIVAIDDRGRPVSFQHLQDRMHVRRPVASTPTAFIAFDLLRDDDEDLRGRPLRERRRRLEALYATVSDPDLRLSEQAVGDGRALHQRAVTEGWEGLLAKRLASPYASGRRSSDWRKLKLERRQTCVVGGWTEPRGSRPCFGALILGVYDDQGALIPVGHIGSGFSDAELARLWTRLRPLERRTCPFATVPPTNERPHWVTPTIAVDVKFTEWTADGQLRHPTYVGLRDDTTPASVRREPDAVVDRAASVVAPTGIRARARPRKITSAMDSADAMRNPRRGLKDADLSPVAVAALLNDIDTLEAGRGTGTLQLPSGERLDVSNLGKVFWPAAKLTKGDLFRHYIRVAPYILPALADRPLVMKRYPNGVDATPFYQQRAPEVYPRGVRIERVTDQDESVPRVIGGSLITLLYTAQLATISQDPWLSRVQSPDMIDHAVIDLDPPDDLPFRQVLDVARWVRDELDRLKVTAFPKLSGAGGLHVYVPLPPHTPYDAGQLFCQIVATIVATRHAKTATIERSIKARGSRIYIDYLQNSRGKTLASVYSARATAFAGVSTPVSWDEIDQGVAPQDFTIKTFAARLAAVGDLWAPLRRSKGANLRAAMKHAATAHG